MPRCSCAGSSCSCAVAAGTGLRVTGTGSADLPFTVSLATPQIDLIQSDDGSLNLGQIEYGEAVDVTLDADATVVMPIEGGDRFDLFVKQGATSKTISWPSAVKWAGGTPPKLSKKNGDIDWLTFRRVGPIWVGVVVALAIS
jgi:hypothetical protein